MDFSKLEQLLIDLKEPKYRFLQITGDIISGRAQTYEDIFTIPFALREKLDQSLPPISLWQTKVLVSQDKKAYKALLNLADGNFIETVLLNPSPSLWSVCLSCQVGCPMACAFCATGKMGLIRNLTAEEICDQILFWRQYITNSKLKIRISNIVYMGMGEPFLNQKAVFQSLAWLTDPKLYAFGQRHISVSTCGIVPGIEAFARQFPQVNLAISLHAPSDELRERLMPVAKQFSLEQLMTSLVNYLSLTNRQLFFEYVMLSSINDDDQHALALGNLIKKSYQDKLHLIHLNLIPYNLTGDKFTGSDDKKIKRFANILKEFHISSTVRKSLGQEIAGACGQLSSTKIDQSL